MKGDPIRNTGLSNLTLHKRRLTIISPHSSKDLLHLRNRWSKSSALLLQRGTEITICHPPVSSKWISRQFVQQNQPQECVKFSKDLKASKNQFYPCKSELFLKMSLAPNQPKNLPNFFTNVSTSMIDGKRSMQQQKRKNGKWAFLVFEFGLFTKRA